MTNMELLLLLIGYVLGLFTVPAGIFLFLRADDHDEGERWG